MPGPGSPIGQTIITAQRPHSALGYLTPAVYAANLTATFIGYATPTSSADRTLLSPRRMA